MKLYDSTLAPNPRRVRMFMAEKGVDYENIQVDIIKGDNLNESFLSINPRGLLPTLVLDDGTVIDETVAICRYIEEMHPEPALLGTDAISKANIEARQRHMEFDGLLAAADAFRNSFPGFSSRGLAGNAGSVDAIPALAERGKNAMLRFYESLNAALNDSAFVAGETFSIADITALCTIDFAAGAARVPIPDQCSNVQRWHANVSSRPSAEA
ncbi:MAG: glutathione S-transferase family protein [Pseudomonadales bacterium]|nr:glutathione S-transferase family protein [Pseudomonadales bacterium]